MAVQKIDVLVDDITGDEGAETFTFASPVDGKTYVLDLTADSKTSVEADLAAIAEAKAAFEATVAEAQATLNTTVTEKSGWFMEAARPQRAARKAAPSDGMGATIRQWAVAQGKNVPARGRLSAELRAEFYAANPA